MSLIIKKTLIDSSSSEATKHPHTLGKHSMITCIGVGAIGTLVGVLLALHSTQVLSLPFLPSINCAISFSIAGISGLIMISSAMVYACVYSVKNHPAAESTSEPSNVKGKRDDAPKTKKSETSQDTPEDLTPAATISSGETSGAVDTSTSTVSSKVEGKGDLTPKTTKSGTSQDTPKDLTPVSPAPSQKSGGKSSRTPTFSSPTSTLLRNNSLKRAEASAVENEEEEDEEAFQELLRRIELLKGCFLHKLYESLTDIENYEYLPSYQKLREQAELIFTLYGELVANATDSDLTECRRYYKIIKRIPVNVNNFEKIILFLTPDSELRELSYESFITPLQDERNQDDSYTVCMLRLRLLRYLRKNVSHPIDSSQSTELKLCHLGALSFEEIQLIPKEHSLFWVNSNQINEALDKASPEELKELVPRFFKTTMIKVNRERFSELAKKDFEVFNKILPYLKDHHLKQISKELILDARFDWNQVKGRESFLFIKKPELLNKFQEPIFSYLVSVLPGSIIISLPLTRFQDPNFPIEKAKHINSVFNLRSEQTPQTQGEADENKKAYLERREKLRSLPSSKLQLIASRLNGSTLSMLSKEQFMQIDSKVFHEMHPHTAQGIRCGGYERENIFLRLGFERTNAIVRHLKVHHLHYLPIDFLQNAELALEKVAPTELKQLYAKNTHLYTKSIQSIPPSKINELRMHVGGHFLAYLSPVQFKELDVVGIPQETLKTLFATTLKFSSHLEKNPVGRLFKDLTLQKVNIILSLIPFPMLLFMDDTMFGSEELEIEKINIHELFKCNFANLELVLALMHKIAQLAPGKFALLAPQFNGQTLAMLSDKQLSLLPETMSESQLEELFHYAHLLNKEVSKQARNTRYSQKLSPESAAILNSLSQRDSVKFVLENLSEALLQKVPRTALEQIFVSFDPKNLKNISSLLTTIQETKNRVQTLGDRIFFLIEKLPGNIIFFFSEEQVSKLDNSKLTLEQIKGLQDCFALEENLRNQINKTSSTLISKLPKELTNNKSAD